MSIDNQIDPPQSFMEMYVKPGQTRPNAPQEVVLARYEQCDDMATILAEQVQTLVFKDIRWAIDFDPDDIDSIFDTASYQDKSKEYLDGEMWAYGFIQGITLARKEWQPLFESAQAMEALMPIYILGTGDASPDQQALSNTPAKREALTQQIPASIGALWRFWHPDRHPKAEVMATPVKRSEPKVGRNDPCPCGSGKKYKKCCGAH